MAGVSTFKPEYCEQLIEHMAEGLSFVAFAGKLRKSKQTLYTWVENHPEFKEAKAVGEAASLYYWETLGKRGEFVQSGEGACNLNTTYWYMNMKNRHGWRDKVEHSGDAKQPIQLKYNLDDKPKDET